MESNEPEFEFDPESDGWMHLDSVDLNEKLDELESGISEVSEVIERIKTDLVFMKIMFEEGFF